MNVVAPVSLLKDGKGKNVVQEEVDEEIDGDYLSVLAEKYGKDSRAKNRVLGFLTDD
jgi:hypothetical protein